ncbi:uncharacterized protein LOC132703654 [Cylas formicarius]|uniref:uncharacterized protein LOC132703654 n=1 Tax=Cylas formicarius TaxID=197179 RepID=UPI002958CD96|nr:uncharacterized protein LOC132703654 [Cylas formicarius]
MKVLFAIGICLVTLASATPINEPKVLKVEDDPIAYFKEEIVSFLDDFLEKDEHEIGDDVKVTKNSYRSTEVTSRSGGDYEDKIENYIKSHDVTFNLPVVGSVTMGARNLDGDELDFKFNFGGVEEARKSKLKKIFIPILVFVLLKAITLVPLALGILSLKAWNALQLSFFSFVISVGLAIFQLCKKIAADSAAPQIAAHAPWEPAQQYYAARSLDAQDLAYSAYGQ